MNSIVKRVTSGDYVYNVLRKRIIAGYYKKGDKLKEVKIGNELEISTTPVREALRRLSAEGYLERLPYKGVVVKGYDLEDKIDAYWVFSNISLLYIDWGMKKLDKEKWNELVEILRRATELDDGRHVYERIQPFYKQLRVEVKSQILESCLHSIQAVVNLESSIDYSKDIQNEIIKLYKGLLKGLEKKDLKEIEKYLISSTKLSIEALKKNQQKT